MIKELLILTGLTLLIIPAIAEKQDNYYNEVLQFLVEDQTDQHKYEHFFTCGHFTRQLSENATREYIWLGGIILGNHPTLHGDNHAANYFTYLGKIYVVEPQNDMIIPIELFKNKYKYYRLYPDGAQVPGKWKGNLSTAEI